ncbi:hypothetical protein [Bacillus sp. NPDC077027]|uniref:hypothetical protein n=1 Tax=Bacillus sp. NPDC077027 TaxID=3390548 RepID=UPI003D060BC4
MKILKLECQRLKIDIVRISFIILLLHLINTIIFIKNLDVLMGESKDAFTLLFSSSHETLMNWMYWLSFCVGYIICLQILWKNDVHMFEINIVLRLGQWKSLWFAKFIIGILFTLYYVFSAVCVAIVLFKCFHIKLQFDLSWFFIFVCLTVSLFIHGILWLILKNHLKVEVANIVILGMLFAGIKLEEPYIPLYYGMYTNLGGNLIAVLLELIMIWLLMIYVIVHAKKIDYV